MKNKGFTLIELLIVITIIGILAGVTLASLGDARVRGKDTGKIRALQETRSALQLYYTENGYYPSGTESTLSGILSPSSGRKFIGSVDSNIKYQGVTASSTSCTNCMSYHIGILLQKSDYKVLQQDAEVDFGFGRNTCISLDTSSSTDYCFDLVP